MTTPNTGTPTPTPTPAPVATNAAITPPNGQPTPPAQPTPQPNAQTPPADPQFASKFAALTRKEQAATKALAEAKTKAAEAERIKAEAQAEVDKWRGYKGNPSKAMEALKELGLTYDQLTQLHLNGGSITPEMQIQQLQERMDKEAAERRQADEAARNAEVESAKAAQQKAIDDFRNSVTAHAEDKTKYPFINHFGQSAQVWSLIEGHYERTCERDADGNVTKAGQILDVEAAAKQVEDFIKGQVTEAQKIMNPAPPANPAPANPPAPKPASKLVSKPANTLTPSTTPVTTPKQTQRYESDQERMARIVAKYSKKPA